MPHHAEVRAGGLPLVELLARVDGGVGRSSWAGRGDGRAGRVVHGRRLRLQRSAELRRRRCGQRLEVLLLRLWRSLGAVGEDGPLRDGERRAVSRREVLLKLVRRLALHGRRWRVVKGRVQLHLRAEGGVGLEDGTRRDAVHVRATGVGYKRRSYGDGRQLHSGSVRGLGDVWDVEFRILRRKGCYGVHCERGLSISQNLTKVFALTLSRQCIKIITPRSGPEVAQGGRDYCACVDAATDLQSCMHQVTIPVLTNQLRCSHQSSWQQ